MNQPTAGTGLIDTHVHFYDRTSAGPRLTWRWLGDEFVHPLIGDINAIKGRRFTPIDLRAEARLCGVRGVVHVQAARDTVDPVDETEWLAGLAPTSPIPIMGIVAEALLQRADAAEVLARHADHPLVRGIRDFGVGEYLEDAAFTKGYAQLARYDWSFDWDAHWSRFDQAARLARQYPDIRLIAEHCGAPPFRDPDGMAAWRGGLRRLAAAPNVAIKLSGWGMYDPSWTPRTVRSMLLHCIDAFGTDRAFFGSNWPFGRLSSSYADVVGVLAQLCDTLTPSERADLQYRSATRWYRLEPPTGD